VDAVLARLDPAHPALASLVEAVVLSDAFRKRRAGGAVAPEVRAFEER
jgi:hypothetical protein